MYTLCYLTVLVTVVTGSVIDDPFTAIINGERANIIDYPFYAHLRYLGYDSLLCGGSIIRPDVILTAAHCISETINFNVYVGVSDEDDIKEAVPYEVKQTIKHPFYFGLPFFDIAIVKLAKNITLNDKVQVAEMATENPPENEEATIVGFGKPKCDKFAEDDPTGQCLNAASDYFRYAIMEITNVGAGLIDSKGDNQNACYGDSGGPMIYDGKLVGVASVVHKHDCTVGNTYTSVSSNKRWIKKQLAK